MSDVFFMSNPFAKILAHPTFLALVLRVSVCVVGLAKDFWKDTPFPKRPPKVKVAPEPKADSKPIPEEQIEEMAASVHRKPWVADIVQVKEQIWGEGNVFPGNDEYMDNLIAPLGLTKEMSVLDLSAGIGGLARKLAIEHDIYVAAFDPSKQLAARGMVMSIAAGKSRQAPVDVYDPVSYEAKRRYDCVFARELFFRVIAKEKFFKQVAASLKPHSGQIVFTDYILDSDKKEKPAIRTWLSHETNMSPMSYIDMVKEWKGLDFDMRVAEDQTDLYREEITKALSQFTLFLKDHDPSSDTKPLIVREVNLWARRVAAFDQGLRYCRFYGIKR